MQEADCRDLMMSMPTLDRAANRFDMFLRMRKIRNGRMNQFRLHGEGGGHKMCLHNEALYCEGECSTKNRFLQVS